MPTLPMPALRWGATTPLPAVGEAMVPLRDALQQRAREAAAEDADGDGP